MICPKCGSFYAEEIVLFSSVEIKCASCDIRKYFQETVESCTDSWRTPIIGYDDQYDFVYKTAAELKAELKNDMP